MTYIRLINGGRRLIRREALVRLQGRGVRRRLIWTRTIALLLCYLLPVVAHAQPLNYDHTTFLNGFASDSTIWSTAYADLHMTPLGYLASAVILKPFYFPSLDLHTRYSDMEGRVATVLTSAQGQHVLVGHSLGSLVARGTYNDNATARARIAGIVAISPPHQGTILADSALKVRAYFGDLQRRIDDAVPGLIVAAGVLIFLTAVVFHGVVAGFPLFIAASFFIQDKTRLDLTNLYQLVEVPAIVDLQTNSPVIYSLNHNFTDSQIQRANVYGSIPVRYAALRVYYSSMDKDADFPGGVVFYYVAVASFSACKYIDYATILGWGLGRRCGFAGRALRRIDDRWTRYVNGSDAYGRPLMTPFDGIVTNGRQHYPSTTQLSFDRPVPGVNHLNIYETQLGLNQVRSAMLSIGMQPLTPPPNAITGVSVTGPTRLNGCQFGTWTATVSGGTPPINYVWTVENQTISTGTSNRLGYTNTGTQPSIFVKVTAKDANYTSAQNPSFKTNITIPGSC